MARSGRCISKAITTVSYAGSGLRGIGEGVEEIDDLLRLVTDEFLQEVGIKLLQRRVIMQGIRTLSVHDKKWSP